MNLTQALIGNKGEPVEALNGTTEETSSEKKKKKKSGRPHRIRK